MKSDPQRFEPLDGRDPTGLIEGRSGRIVPIQAPINPFKSMVQSEFPQTLRIVDDVWAGGRGRHYEQTSAKWSLSLVTD
jgi:hypothetical protein